MSHETITFSRAFRWIVITVAVIGAIWMLNYLSSVLLPFVVGWLLAYMLYPLVKFIQYKLHFRKRFLSSLAAIVFVIGVVSAVIYLISEPMYEQMLKLKDLVVQYITTNDQLKEVPANIQIWFQENIIEGNMASVLSNSSIESALKEIVPGVFSVVGRTFQMLIGIIASFITLLYMFFILNDYEDLSHKFLRVIPKSKQSFWQTLIGDVKNAMNSYFRGQALVSLCMACLFAIGFTIIDFPMAIGLALLIGIMNMVPYLHTLALIPTFFLALLKAADTHQNFWVILISALAVFIIVQIICDMVVTPKIMGKAMNLNPAIIFLSLSVWGMLLGFIGLIIALPLTTLVIDYYKLYVLHRTDEKE
ncbi:MAG: AI-2E family transporter [Prevotellaceae bacterium]|nr:AI-2E family transporter [Prevotellaceae bacterium]